MLRSQLYGTYLAPPKASHNNYFKQQISKWLLYPPKIHWFLLSLPALLHVRDVTHVGRQAQINTPQQKNDVMYMQRGFNYNTFVLTGCMSCRTRTKNEFLFYNIVTRLHQNFRKGHLQEDEVNFTSLILA